MTMYTDTTVARALASFPSIQPHVEQITREAAATTKMWRVRAIPFDEGDGTLCYSYPVQAVAWAIISCATNMDSYDEHKAEDARGKPLPLSTSVKEALRRNLERNEADRLANPQYYHQEEEAA